jgi:hypothetical protein
MAKVMSIFKGVAKRKVNCEVILMTPKLAKSILETCNTGNRKLRAAHVRKLAGAMTRGEWNMNHQGIAFADTGRLLDGQHRLNAVIQSGKSVDFVVFHDLDEKTYRGMDKGAGRSHANSLGMDENLASILGKIYDLSNPRESATPDIIEKMDSVFGATASALLAMKSPTRKKVSNATVRAVATLRAMMNPSDRGYVFMAYHNMCRKGEGSELSRTTNKFLEICRSDSAGRSQSGGRDKFVAQAWIGLNPEKQNLSVIRVANPKKTSLEVQDFIMKAIANA